MTERYELDPAHTLIGFTAKHLGVTQVRGSFQKFSGWVEGEPANPASLTGEITVDVASLTTGVEQRDNHLRSSDFFDAEKYPTAVFRPTSAEQIGDHAYRVTGDLTIREVSRPLTLEVKVEGQLQHPFQPDRKLVAISATGELKRKDFGLNWDGLAGAIPLASNEIKLSIEAELVSAVTAGQATA